MEFKEVQQNFIQLWGILGSSWGINKTMAQIHALLLSSAIPLSTEDIMEQLSISRGNANTNIRALLDWGIVQKEFKIGDRKDYFSSKKDIWELAKQVTKERQRREIEPVLQSLNELKQFEAKNEEEKEFKKTLEDLESFTEKVMSVLNRFIKSDENWFYKSLINLIK